MDSLPTTNEILDAPELAVPAVLATTLEVTEATLLSVHPDLHSPLDYLRNPALPGSSALAFTLLTLIRVLAEQIDLYRGLAGEDPDQGLSGDF